MEYVDKVLHDFNDIQIFAKIQFGSQRDTFDMIFDSGSSWVWLATDKCASCVNPHKYSARNSTSFA